MCGVRTSPFFPWSSFLSPPRFFEAASASQKLSFSSGRCVNRTSAQFLDVIAVLDNVRPASAHGLLPLFTENAM